MTKDLLSFTAADVPEIAATAPSVSTDSAPVAASGVDGFVQQFLPLAQRVSEKTGVAPQVLLGQWGLETGWGKSVIPGTNNLGNIKDPSRRGPTAVDNMTKSSDSYMAFDSADAFGDHYADLLARRYRSATGAGDDPQKFFTELQRGGYAQDKGYVQKGVRAANMVASAMGAAPREIVSVHGPESAGSSGEPYYTPDNTRYATYKDPGPGASSMDFFKEVAASAVESVGSAAQAVGEVAAGAANKITGSQDFEGFNPLQPVAESIRGSMTEGGRTAREQGFQGDVLDPSTWQLPSSPQGWVMAAANGFGSMAATLLPALGQAGKVASLTRALEAAKAAGDAVKVTELSAAVRAASARTAATGAASDAAVTGGAAAQDVRQSAAKTVAGMTHDELLTSVPVYAQAFAETGDEQQARQAVVNRAAQFAGAFSAAAGAVGGAFNARVLEDFIAHKGMATMLGNSVGSRTGRAAIGAGVGHVAEGGQEVAEKVGQNAGENVALGRDAGENVTRDSLGDFMGGAMVGGGVGAVAGAGSRHAAPAVPPGLEKVAEKAAEPDSPLSRAAMAGNTGPLAQAARAAAAQQDQAAQAEAAKPDPLTERSAQIADTLRQKGALQALRGKDSPVKVQKVLEDLALAQSPSARPDQREQAIGRLEYALEWAGVHPAAQVAPAVQQIVGEATDPTAAPADGVSRETSATDPAAQRAAIDAATGTTFGPKPPAPAPQAVPYDNTTAQQQVAQYNERLQASNEEAAAKLPPAPDVDRVIQALKVEPALRTAEQTSLVKQAAARYQPEDMQLLQFSATYAAGMSATQKLRVQQLRGVGNPALVIGRDEGANAAAEVAAAEPPQAAPDSGPVVPNMGGAAPAGEGPAVFRKRRATLRQLIDMGMSRVERRGNEFFLTDGKKSFKLDGAADAQLARRELQDAIRAGAERANTAPTEGQKQAGNYKKGRVEFDGLRIGIENPVGSERSGTSPDGTKWSVKMSAHYGDLTSTTGADGDGVDVYLVDSPRAGSPVWVFDQYNDDGSFDEHKAVLGVPSEEAATQVYDAHFSDGSGPRRRRAVTKMSVDEFKAWANSPAAKKPAAGDKSGKPGPVAAGAPAATAGRGSDHAAAGVAPASAGSAGGDVGNGPDNPATGAERRGGETGALDHGGERAYVTVRVKGVKRQVPVIDITKLGSAARDGNRTTVSRENAELIKAIAQVFGKDVVFFQNPERDLGDGFVMPKVNSAIFINESTTIQPLAVFGHELLHLMQREMPQVHAALRAVVSERIKDGGRKEFRDDYNGKSAEHTDEALNSDELEELTSDLGGNLMSDQAFWREVMDRVQQDHPEQAKTLVAQLAAKLYALIDKLVAALRGIRQPGFSADHFVNDLKTIRLAMRDAVAQYVAAHNIKGMPAEVARSQRSQDAQKSDATQSPQRDNSEDVSTEGDSAGELGRSSEAPTGKVPEYGTPREGAVSVLATHYGKQARKELSSAAYGRGLKGGERERVMEADDKRLRDRIYFYVDQGKGTHPEAGVGPYAHEVRLNNIYDPRTGLVKSNGGSNAFESAVIDAGFDGYLNPDFTTRQGAVVLLGKHNVPVKPVGMQSATAGEAPKVEETQKKFESHSVDKHPELSAVDVEKIPGARLKYGYLTVPVESKEQANAELERIGSDVRFSPARNTDSPIDEYETIRSKYLGTKEWMKAPNGRASLLNERQWVHVRTPAFKAWFGDWEKFAREHGPSGVWHDSDGVVSKAVDVNGEPMVVYHGTDNAGFAAFWETGGRQRGDLGIWAASDLGMARSYVRRGRASMVAESDIDTEDAGNRKSGVYALFMNLRTATEEDFDGAQWSGDYFDERGKLAPERNIGRVTDDVVREARNVFGADGAIIRNLSDDGGGAGYSGEPGDVFVAFAPSNVKSADFNEGSYSLSSDDIRLSKSRDTSGKPQRVNEFEMSTRAPWAKANAKFTPEDAVDNLLIADFSASDGQQKWLQAVSDLVEQYPNYRATESAKTPEKKLERLVKHMVDNLVWLHDQVPAQIRERSKLWYDGANSIAQRWAKRYDLSDHQVSGIMAVLSPQKDWFMNVSLAQRVIEILEDRQAFHWSKEMEATAARIFGKAEYQEDINQIRGKALQDIDDDYLSAMWIRLYDEAHNSRSFMIVSPEGDFVAEARTKTGQASNVAWGGISTIAKAVSIARDGSFTNISNQLGRKHKVRNFYNNILVPNSPNGHVTIDTHAVAAALLRALSGNSLEVTHNFSGPASAHAGLSGVYPLYEEAYRRAAEQRNVLPRELQSITWEAVRGLFVPSFKQNADRVEMIDRVWRQFKKGRLSHANAQEEIIDVAGGINDPVWVGRDPGAYEEDGSAADEGDVSGDGVSRGGAESAAGGARSDDSAGAEEVRLSAARTAGGSEQAGDGAGRGEGGSAAPLAGAPTVRGASGPDPRLVEVARQFARARGITLRRQAEYVKVDPERAARIAAAYDAMPHAPSDPKVRAAYDSLIEQTRAQYDALVDAGYEFSFFDSGSDPYDGNPWNAMRDLRANKRMAVYGTYDGFGTEGITKTAIDDNPMLADTGLRWEDQDGQEHPVTANDLFRAVHDAFGHGLEGAGFRADGEENAWQAHVRMFTGPAVGAITSETRGQNSWLNFGPYGERNRTAKVEDTVFAEQKTGLMPEWTWTEGIVADERPPRRKSPSRDAGLVQMRKDASVLKSLLSCLG